MDHLTPQQRSKNMAAVHSKDTGPELVVRKGLWRKGFRYRLNDIRLPGRPDLVLKKYRTCIFINGCFWHGHVGCKYYTIPKSNTEFWVAKVKGNKERDKDEQRKLASMGWHCITVWECELKPAKREKTLDSIAYTLNHIWLQDHNAKVNQYPMMNEEEMQMPMAAEDCIETIIKSNEQNTEIL